jgi:DNA-directed RNA polymerase specialized sigma24 family protein
MSSDGSVTRWLGPLPAGDPVAVEHLWQTPELAARMAEECQRLLDALPEELRQAAVLKMEGHSNEEIAVRLGLADRPVKRRLEAIREVWRNRGGEG